MYLGGNDLLRRVWICLSSAATGTYAYATHGAPFLICDV